MCVSMYVQVHVVSITSGWLIDSCMYSVVTCRGTCTTMYQIYAIFTHTSLFYRGPPNTSHTHPAGRGAMVAAVSPGTA